MLLLLYISHLLSDFLFQLDWIVELKAKRECKGFMSHFLIIFLTTAITIMIFYGFITAIKLALILSCIHIAIDAIKEQINKNSPPIELTVFIIDQLVHFITIYLMVQEYFLDNITAPVMENINELSISMFNTNVSFYNILVFIIIYLLILLAGAILLEKILKLINVGEQNQNSDIIGDNKGKYIGIIERALILTLVTFGSISSIGIIFTAKSLARFKELSNKDFVEYYLFGSLSSIFLALVGGLLLRNIIR